MQIYRGCCISKSEYKKRIGGEKQQNVQTSDDDSSSTKWAFCCFVWYTWRLCNFHTKPSDEELQKKSHIKGKLQSEKCTVQQPGQWSVGNLQNWVQVGAKQIKTECNAKSTEESTRSERAKSHTNVKEKMIFQHWYGTAFDTRGERADTAWVEKENAAKATGKQVTWIDLWVSLLTIII